MLLGVALGIGALAHAATDKTSAKAFRCPGTPCSKQLIAMAKDIGADDEVWRNSPTNAVEKKHLLIRWVEDVPLGVGCHTPN
ncbi:hypothetical protein [Pseudomonas sp. DNDY-54]|uniref:hypothetical protein n=1 Tax=Pseudomonas sp. DNDY-54 TaxID=2870860 RepID=UPI001CA3FD92|nr:hypothetical protein [Pseudomonas sp. DNDY-54]